MRLVGSFFLLWLLTASRGDKLFLPEGGKCTYVCTVRGNSEWDKNASSSKVRVRGVDQYVRPGGTGFDTTIKTELGNS